MVTEVTAAIDYGWTVAKRWLRAVPNENFCLKWKFSLVPRAVNGLNQALGLERKEKPAFSLSPKAARSEIII